MLAVTALLSGQTGRYTDSLRGLLHEANGAVVIEPEQAGAYVNSFGFRVNPDHSLIVSAPHSFGATFDGGGSALVAGTSYLTVPYACTLSAWNILVDTGTATFQVWRVAARTAIPTVSNTLNTSGVSISSNTVVRGFSLTSARVPHWTLQRMICCSIDPFARLNLPKKPLTLQA